MEYLQAILKTLQNPNSTAGEGTTPPAWPGPSTTNVIVSALLHASLFTSLFAALLAMLGKQWINRYARHHGGSVPERCEDRQRKLNGLGWTFRIIIESLPVFVQLSLSLLGVALVISLWGVNRVTASVIAGLTALGALFYLCISIAATLSYECPFQTPVSLIFRWFWKLFSKPTEPDCSADCVFWTLDRITDPEVTNIALRYLANIKWHGNPPDQVPWLPVTRIYTKCFDASQRVLSESKEIAYAAGMALIQLYFHRLHSDVDVGGMPEGVTEAFNHLCSDNRNDNLRPLALIAGSIEKPDRNHGCRWDLSHFDLRWATETWVHYALICRGQLEPGQSESIIQERNVPADLSAFFEKEGGPPPSVVRNILRGLLVFISSDVPSLNDLIDHERYFVPSCTPITTRADVFVRAESDSQLFQRLGDEMVALTDHRLLVLRDVLKPLLLWRHERAEIVGLCCRLLKAVVETYLPEVPPGREVVCLLCQIAFRDPSQATALDTTPLDFETLDNLARFTENGQGQFLGDLIPVLSSFPWEENQQQTIIQMILDAPVPDAPTPDAPDAFFSQRFLSAAVTMIGRVQFPVVKAADCNKMLELVKRLPVNTLVERIIVDDSVRPGWMRLLLWYTCPCTPDDIRSHRSLWHILLALVRRRPPFFPAALSNHVRDAWLTGLDTNLGGLDGNQTAEIVQKRHLLWARLFWSSRYFETDRDFKNIWILFWTATGELVRPARMRGFLPGLLGLCAALERPDPGPSHTYLTLQKLSATVEKDPVLRVSPPSIGAVLNATPPGVQLEVPPQAATPTLAFWMEAYKNQYPTD